MTRWRLSAALAAVAIIVAVGVVDIAPAGALPGITGGGSGFAALEIDQWRADTARAPFNLQVTYVAQGSSVGRNKFTQGLFDFGASDIVYTPEELPSLRAQRCKGRPPSQCFVYVPVSAGGLAFMYNLLDDSGRRISDLRLTRRAACKIFTGAIRKWNDPEIVRTNPRLSGIDRDINTIVRADGAGESYVLSEFCIAVARDVWQAFITDRKNDPDDSGSQTIQFLRGDPVSNWPANQGVFGPIPQADNVANAVADPITGKNAITYDAAGYAKVRNFPVASVENAVGNYTQPDEDNVTSALRFATGRGDGTFILNFTGPDARAYFPSTYSYVLAQTVGFDPGKGATLGRFLCYSVSKGQDIAPQLRYARLSREIQQISIDAISRIPGAPAKADCAIGGLTSFSLQQFGGSVNPGASGPAGGSAGTGTNNGTAGARKGSGAKGSAAIDKCVAQHKAKAKAKAKKAKTKAKAKSTTTTTIKRRKARAATKKKSPTTTTTIPRECLTKASLGARSGASRGTLNQVDEAGLDNKLASQTGPSTGGSKGISAIWLLVAGIVAAWAVGFALTRRRITT